MIEAFPALNRTVPVEEKIEAGHEEVIPKEEISKIIDEYETIAVTNC